MLFSRIKKEVYLIPRNQIWKLDISNEDIAFRKEVKQNKSKWDTFGIRTDKKETLNKIYDLLYQNSSFFYPRKKKAWEDLKNEFDW